MASLVWLFLCLMNNPTTTTFVGPINANEWRCKRDWFYLSFLGMTHGQSENANDKAFILQTTCTTDQILFTLNIMHFLVLFGLSCNGLVSG